MAGSLFCNSVKLRRANPQIVARLTKLLEKYVSEGRSTPGLRQTNTVPVKIRKQEPAVKDGGEP